MKIGDVMNRAIRAENALHAIMAIQTAELRERAEDAFPFRTRGAEELRIRREIREKLRGEMHAERRKLQQAIQELNRALDVEYGEEEARDKE